MENKKNTPKHSVGNDAQKEKFNADNEPSYVEDSKKEKTTDSDKEGNYLEKKWKKISTDFQKNYNVEVSESDYKSDSFSETLKKLEDKTGKTRSKLEQEIKDWENS